MKTQLNEYNYLPIALTDLPSGGFMYPKNAIIKGRFLTIQDVKLIALITDETATKVINEVLDRCFYMKGLEVKDLLACDRQYLAFWLRANSFQQDSGYDVEIGKCPFCRKPFRYRISLEDIPIKTLDKKPAPFFTLPSGETVGIKLPMATDANITDNNEEIELVARMIDVPNPLNYVLNMNAYDYRILLRYCKQFNAGFAGQVQIECPHCHNTIWLKTTFNDNVLFKQVNYRDIIINTMRIAKYTNWVAGDNMPWTEFEMMQDVCNKMIEEENKAHDELQRQARTSMHSNIH